MPILEMYGIKREGEKLNKKPFKKSKYYIQV